MCVAGIRVPYSNGSPDVPRHVHAGAFSRGTCSPYNVLPHVVRSFLLKLLLKLLKLLLKLMKLLLKLLLSAVILYRSR